MNGQERFFSDNASHGVVNFINNLLSDIQAVYGVK